MPACQPNRLEHAFVAARLERWDEVRAVLAGLPPGIETARRHLIDAMLADHEQNWAAADAAYARAETLAENPAGALNNWGVPQLSRGALQEAAELFEHARSPTTRESSAPRTISPSLAGCRATSGCRRCP